MSTLTFAGNLATDPETRFTPSGRQVVRLMVIENRRRRNQDGTSWEDAEPNVYYVQAWAGLAENVAESCSKGDRVTVTGSVITDRWTDKDSGEQRTSQHVKADEIGFSLRYHTVQATKAPRQQQQSEPEVEGHEE